MTLNRVGQMRDRASEHDEHQHFAFSSAGFPWLHEVTKFGTLYIKQ